MHSVSLSSCCTPGTGLAASGTHQPWGLWVASEGNTEGNNAKVLGDLCLPPTPGNVSGISGSEGGVWLLRWGTGAVTAHQGAEAAATSHRKAEPRL